MQGECARLRGVLSNPDVQAALTRARADPETPESRRLINLLEIARAVLGEAGEGEGRS